MLCLTKLHILSEFARNPRSVAERHRWKATEYRHFLLYTGPVALLDVLSSPVYSNFMLLYVAISILACPNLCVTFCDFAKTLFVSFVEYFGQIVITDECGSMLKVENPIWSKPTATNYQM